VERRVTAYFPPKATPEAYRIFSFLRGNDSHVISAGGMQHFVLGLDKSKLLPLAEVYGLEFDRIIPFVSLYESEMMKQQQRKLSENHS
jgi:hypothetical protein